MSRPNRLGLRPGTDCRRHGSDCEGAGRARLVNAQFIVRRRRVYLIEVNPRASRTVPFMSKVTGVPMVRLAVRIALGETLARDGVGERACSPRRLWSRFKAPPSLTAKLRGVDRASAPGMQSTGEVWSFTTDPRVALAKRDCRDGADPARRATDGALALISVETGDKTQLRAGPGRWRGALSVCRHRRTRDRTAELWPRRPIRSLRSGSGEPRGRGSRSSSHRGGRFGSSSHSLRSRPVRDVRRRSASLPPRKDPVPDRIETPPCGRGARSGPARPPLRVRLGWRLGP